MTLRADQSTIRDVTEWDEIQFRAGRGLQPAELNEMQAIGERNLTSVANAIFSDGDRTNGCDIHIDQETGQTRITAGAVYLRGQVRQVPAVELIIPVVGEIKIGLCLTEHLITENDDPALRGPEPNTRNYGEPGAARLSRTLSWGLQADCGDDFYSVFEVVDGVVRNNRPAPEFDGIYEIVARYDRESNGDGYVINGMQLKYLGLESIGNVEYQVFSLSAGKAHVLGYEVELPYALRLRYLSAQDLQTVESEPSLFVPDAGGNMRIDTHQSPMTRVLDVEITEETTVTLTHGSYSGVSDPLPDNAVLEIISVVQGGTTYTKTSDYKLTGAYVDWSLSGAEPAPGSTYAVTYRHQKKIEALGSDETGLMVTGAVPGTLVLIDYEWALPRIDILTIDRYGVVRQIKGIPHAYRAPVPAVPSGQLLLATIYQNWMFEPTIRNNAVRVVAMDDLQNMQASIYDLYDLVAIERLKNDAVASEQTAKRGVFVDPFLDDDMRDQGLEQTAAIMGGELQLAIDVDIIDLPDAPLTLPYMLEPVLEQLAQTGMMKVNPYSAFDPIPAEITLTPDVDFWVDERSTWSSPETNRISSGNGSQSATLTDSRTEMVAVNTRAAEFLRVREVEFHISGFAPGEQLMAITFDGIPVTPVEV